MRLSVRLSFALLVGLSLVGSVAVAPKVGGRAAAAQDAPKKKGKLKVTVPEDDAVLTIEGKTTKMTGTTRSFDIPALDPAKKYEYKLSVEWRPNNYTVMTRNKTVVFAGGTEVEADLSVDDPADKAVIRFVPTPDDIVAAMVKLANVTKDDIVYEPGCGDARITVAAVKAGAKKGVGVDLDPERIKEAKETVGAAKLGDKVEIRLGDALDIKDFSDATVVFLYMGNEFDMLIRPVLWKTLKPGTRIVSHRFLMGDWKPDETKKITGEDGEEYEIHKWTITDEVKKKAEKK
jgi:uncharacterized protein (TIGR03000 family)